MLDAAYEAEVYYNQDDSGFEPIAPARPLVKAGDDAPYAFLVSMVSDAGIASEVDVLSYQNCPESAKALAVAEFPEYRADFAKLRWVADF